MLYLRAYPIGYIAQIPTLPCCKQLAKRYDLGDNNHRPRKHLKSGGGGGGGGGHRLKRAPAKKRHPPRRVASMFPALSAPAFAVLESL